MRRLLKNKRGFTMVEIVVVVVIVALLAVILVPRMLEWVDTAHERTVISAADTIRNAVCAEILELYKDGEHVDGTHENACYDEDFWDALRAKLGAEVQCTDPDENRYVTFTVVKGDVTELTYTEGNRTAVYSNGDWTCTAG